MVTEAQERPVQIVKEGTNTMNAYTIELPTEIIDTVTVDNLTLAKELLESDLIRGPNGFGVFHKDLDEDKAEIQRHLDALNIVIAYFSPPGPE